MSPSPMRFLRRVARSFRQSVSRGVVSDQYASWRRLPGPRARLGENPRWDRCSRSIFWIDIPEGILFRYAVDTDTTTTCTLGAETGMLAITPDGDIAVGMGDELRWFDLTHSTLSPWCTLSPFDATTCRMNDAAWHPDGALLVATMDRRGDRLLGGLYRITVDGDVGVVSSGFRIANGPAMDPALGVAYIADSPLRRILRAPIDQLSELDAFVEFTEDQGFPDGLAVDAKGGLWVAHYDGGCVSRWAADGSLDVVIETPVARPTAIALVPQSFGETLAITSAQTADGDGGHTYIHTRALDDIIGGIAQSTEDATA